MKKTRRALVIGSGGQDGRLLTSYLVELGVEVVGVSRRGTFGPNGRLAKTDIRRPEEVFSLVRRFKPDEIYYLAAIMHSSQDKTPDPLELFRESYDVHVLSLVNFLEALRRFHPGGRLFYAASSHVFGAPPSGPQNERTPLAPNNIYGMSKAGGLWACRYYREKYGIFASTGIFYNHESSLRGEGFISRKIIRAAAAIRRGGRKGLVLGSLSVKVDWGWAPDYVEAMRRILAAERSDEFVIATGERHSVAEFARKAFARFGLDWRRWVKEDPAILTRKLGRLVGDPSRLKRRTGWKPTVDFDGMIRLLAEDAAQ